MAKRSFIRFVEQELGTFPHFVVCAVLEWVLIILLFLDGFVAFLANEFAKFFELRVPCLFCTRIDHVFLHKNNAHNFYYNNSICEAHKKDISSLAYCHSHKKLSDIRGMCEVCLLSFATEKESDCNTYKSLVGILHKDLECFVDDDNRQVVSLPVGKKDDGLQMEKCGGGWDFCCSCCGEPLKVKSSNSKGKNGSTFSQAPAPAPAPSPRAAFASLKHEEKSGLELPHIRYTELKLLSDSESEFVEDDEGLHARTLDAHPFKEDVKAVKMPLLPETEDHDNSRTPAFGRGNKFFGIPLTDSANNSPRWATRIPRKSPLERTELTAETYEADMLGPGDNDSILNCLKRQVRIDRKSLMELYMELDEERSASAVAANNAMAMITRLQAEKAAVHMEALQYQRMMEEQAEYDQEALQATNDVLGKREEEIKVLEAELDAYREKYGYLGEGSPRMSEDEISDEDYQEFKSQSYLSSDEKSECSTPFSYTGRENNKESFNNLDVMIIPSVLKIAEENSKEESTNSDEVALPFSQGKTEESECSTPFSYTGRENNKESFNDLDVMIIPSVLKIAEENSKEESTNSDEVALPFSQRKAEESECSTPFSYTGRENNKESFNDLDVMIIPSVLKIAEENNKEESTNSDEVDLPFSQGKAEESECSTPFSYTGRENNKESFNNLDMMIIPSELKIAEENSKEESTNSDEVALPFSQGKAEEEDQNEPMINFNGENTQNEPVTNFKEEKTQNEPVTNFNGEKTQNEPVTNFKGEKIQNEPVINFNGEKTQIESVTNFDGEKTQDEPMKIFDGEKTQNETVRSFKGEKTYLLGRLRKSKNISSFDYGESSPQSTPGSANKVYGDTGKGRTAKLTRQLSHINNTVRPFNADDESSKQEGKRDLTETSNNLRKRQNLVNENSDS